MRTILAMAALMSMASGACKKDGDGGAARPAPGEERTALEPADAGSAEEALPPPPGPTVVASARGDCSVDYAPRPKRDPNPMCKIAGGTFFMGTDDKEAGLKNEWPRHEVHLSPYYIDQFEVTVAQVMHYLNAVGSHEGCESATDGECVALASSSSSPILLEEGRYLAPPGMERHPFVWINLEGARRYCAWVGKRLPTEAEWEFAGRHDPETGRDLVYPWGDEFEPGRAACGEPACRDGFENLAPVGTFDGTGGRKDGSSPWGVHDLVGNAAEWVADCAGRYQPCDGPCGDPARLPESGECRTGVFRGTPLLDTFGAARIEDATRLAWRNPISASTPFFGFRCTRPATPASK